VYVEFNFSYQINKKILLRTKRSTVFACYRKHINTRILVTGYTPAGSYYLLKLNIVESWRLREWPWHFKHFYRVGLASHDVTTLSKFHCDVVARTPLSGPVGTDILS